MDGDRVYRGIIATTKESEVKIIERRGVKKVQPMDGIYKKNAVLIKVGEDKYIDLDSVRGNMDLLKQILKNEVLITKPSNKSDKYVIKKSLKPYYAKKGERTNIKQLKLNKKALDIRH